MAELEKVIKGLEICIRVQDNEKCPDECPYRKDICYGTVGLMADALSLLKAQEARVLSYDEMMKAEICFLEVKGIEEIDPFIRFEVDDKSYWSSPYTNNEDNPFELLAEQEDYLKNARCWTSRPTEEQREKVKWDG